MSSYFTSKKDDAWRLSLRSTPKLEPTEQEVLHNRWHPDIPMVATVKPGAEFRVECVDWTGGQISDDDSATDIEVVDLTKVHYLSGPIGVEGAKPGDLLKVDILDVGVLPESDWGFTGLFARENGGGFLTDHYPEARKACWNFSGIYANSRHIPGVEFAGIMHPGLIGCLPSKELLDDLEQPRNRTVQHRPDRVPPLACLPYAETAHMGALKGAARDAAAAEGARTVPPREHGGNCDIKNLSRGSTVYFPVYVDGGGLSMGDIHFSQGDGEITFCGAIEMAGYLDIRVDIVKNGVEAYGIKTPYSSHHPSSQTTITSSCSKVFPWTKRAVSTISMPRLPIVRPVSMPLNISRNSAIQANKHTPS